MVRHWSRAPGFEYPSLGDYYMYPSLGDCDDLRHDTAKTLAENSEDNANKLHDFLSTAFSSLLNRKLYRPSKRATIHKSVEQHLLAILNDTVQSIKYGKGGKSGTANEAPSADEENAWKHHQETGPYPESLLEHIEMLSEMLDILDWVLASCQYFTRKSTFTLGLTEIALRIAHSGPPGYSLPGLSLLPENGVVVPYMMQPPWLRMSQTETIKQGETACCPGHCNESSCIEYCFSTILKYAEQIHHPYTSLTEEHTAEAMAAAGMLDTARAPIYELASLMLRRLLGPLSEFTHPVTLLGRFCKCPATVELQEARMHEFPGWDKEMNAWGIVYADKHTHRLDFLGSTKCD